ncbi:MAG: hypothetical protein U0793_12575 [Gemmataceae bacterium]
MIAVFVVGLVGTMLGLTLLFKGEARFGKRRIRKRPARALGIFLVSFFPAILIGRMILRIFDPDEEEIDPVVIHCSLAGLWLLISFIWYLKVVQVAGRKKATPAASEPAFDDASAGAGEQPWPAPARRQRGRASENPFDF